MNKKALKSLLKQNYMIISITIGMIIGFLVGLTLKLAKKATKSEESSELSDVSLWFILPGQLFIRSLELLILPVIFFGVVKATSSFNIKSNARLSIACLIITLSSNIIASFIGLIGSMGFMLIYSSNNSRKSDGKSIVSERSFYDIIADLLRNMIPTNIFKATLFQELTVYVNKTRTVIINGNESHVEDYLVRNIVDKPNSNVLGVLIFAILIGIAAGVIKEKGESFRIFIISINEVVITVLRWLISTAPIGIGSLIIKAVIEIKDLGQTFKEVWVFAGIVIVCSLFYSFCFQSALVFLFTRKNPFSIFPKLIEPLVLAFASTSGAVCMHKSMNICEEKLNISPTVARFSIPFFTTLKSDGSIMFITVATIFLAKYNNYMIEFQQYILILFMTCTICLSSPPG
jgi:Na+/H+-dicarboxylate symporter